MAVSFWSRISPGRTDAIGVGMTSATSAVSPWLIDTATLNYSRPIKMPSIRLSNIAAGVANALDGLQFQDIPEPGALVSISATTAVALGTISYAVGTERFLVLASINIEQNADEVRQQEDLVLDREPVPAGKQFLSVEGQVANLLVVIEDLPGG